jgi:hypothetical protein
MKQISKTILAAVATVALAAPAFAWDFSASGSSEATYKRSTYNSGASGENDTVTNEYSSIAGGVTVSSSHTDGPNSATFSYTADWNGDAGNFDEYVKVSGTKKVGNWTASSSTTQHMQKDVYPTTSSSTPNSAQPMQANNSAAITLTDGSITYTLGDAAHLSTAEKTVNGPMSGQVDSEARVDSFEGFSVGLSVGPGTLTVAIDENDDSDVFGDRDLTIACGGDNMGYGLNFAGDVGVELSVTYAMGSGTAAAEACTGDNSSDSANASTLGVGVKVPFGGMALAIDFESTAWDSTTGTTGTNVETKDTLSGSEVSFTMPVGDATVGINVSSQEALTNVAGTDTSKTSTSGVEAWYTTAIGPVTLSAGYGSQDVTTGVSTTVTATTTQMGATMSMSF